MAPIYLWNDNGKSPDVAIGAFSIWVVTGKKRTAKLLSDGGKAARPSFD
jgi:hypothetical protein